ncbi:MAG TPA: PAS domain S-box protein [Candidatus Acidoferrales bacterium]|nr:PAS domain S-box protein [Candidatus Acidoferrales bacterium]
MKKTQSESAGISGLKAANWQHVERRQWWLSSSGIAVSLILTLGIVTLLLPAILPDAKQFSYVDTSSAMRGLLALIFVFDVYVIFQQVQIYRFRKQLAVREELFRLISENAVDMIALVDVDGTRLYNSPSYQRILGYSAEELRGISPIDQIHPDDRQKVIDAAKEAQTSGRGRRLEYRIRHRDGRWFTLESTASAVRNREGKVEKLVIVNRDITERKHLEEQLHLSQRLEAVGRLSGGVAHDFNNLLGVIIGYGEALQERIPRDDPNREAIDEIQKAGQRAAALARQLLAVSRKQVLEPRILSLNSIALDVEKVLRRTIGADIQLEFNLASHLGMVRADRGQIEQVIMNLAINARDAMPNGGLLMIETEPAELDYADSLIKPYVVPGRYILLKVTDTGCGMDSDTQSRIFEPFFTTKEKGKGTGLGLAMAYGIVKQSGGYIWVDSEPGHGTTFKIFLPEVEGTPEDVEESAPAFQIGQSRGVILLVEDESSLRKLTKRTLIKSGHTVLEASNADQALYFAKQSDTHIDVLLTDVIMPGMNGRLLAEAVSALRPGIPVLYMSGYDDGELSTKGVLKPGMSILRKPFSRDQLVQAVEEVLIAITEGKAPSEVAQ